MAEYPITLRVTQHTSPLITNSVVALGNQGVVCWFVNPMRESIEFGVFVSYGPLKYLVFTHD